MKRVLAASIAAVLAIGTLAGCGSKADGGSNSAGEDVIKIGIFEPLTGANAAGGQLEVEGMTLANEIRP